jgi:hypothetical protein
VGRSNQRSVHEGKVEGGDREGFKRLLTAGRHSSLAAGAPDGM